jgi:hypothetical protein
MQFKITIPNKIIRKKNELTSTSNPKISLYSLIRNFLYETITLSSGYSSQFQLFATLGL